MPIRPLSETMVNQIAAGEVIERPASVVKELVENALDAGASRIDIATAGGGLNLIRVTDDGSGIPEAELPLAGAPHCTSKLTDDINAIQALGFRGEALPSIGSVARLTIRSRTPSAGNGAEIVVDGGRVAPVRPAASNTGTLVEVRDLFFATPARLKFMKGERAEATAIADTVKRIAIAFPQVRFNLSGPDRGTIDLPPAGEGFEGRLHRIAQVLGREFAENSLPVDAWRESVRLEGYISIPAYSRANSLQQFAYVNGRPVRDKLIAGALRAGFADVLPRDRHPVTALFLTLDPALVDVNVHPAKSDVRFRDPGLVRGLIVGAIRETLARSGIRAATSGADAMMSAFRTEGAPFDAASASSSFNASGRGPGWSSPPVYPSFGPSGGFGEAMQAAFETARSTDMRAGTVEPAADLLDRDLGAARAQVHENYIVAQTRDSLIIVDQHAAHERLVYEALKKALASRDMPAQMLLVPEIVDLGEDDCERIARHAGTLRRFGFSVERFGPGAIAVRETPAMLGEVDAGKLIPTSPTRSASTTRRRR